jgi:hypothetical protein
MPNSTLRKKQALQSAHQIAINLTLERPKKYCMPSVRRKSPDIYYLAT